MPDENLNCRSIDVLAQERSDLRGEIGLLENSMIKITLLFVTVTVGFIALYVKKEIVNDKETLGFLLLLLSQVEIVCGLLVISIMINIGVHAGYMRGLEHQINRFFQKNVSIWETVITRKYIAGKRSPFFWASCMWFGIGILVFVFICWALQDVMSSLDVQASTDTQTVDKKSVHWILKLWWIVVVESALILGFAVCGYISMSGVEQVAVEAFGSAVEDERHREKA